MPANATALPTPDVGIATDFVLKLVQLGFIGLAGLLFVLVFLILWKNQQADEGMAKFRMAFLIIGFLSVLVSVGVQLLPSKSKTSVTISPDLVAAGLSIPAIRILPAGIGVNPDEEFILSSGSTISIRVDRLLKETEQLQATTRELAAVTSQLATAKAAKPAEAQEVKELSTEVNRNVMLGDFAAARKAARQLSDVSDTISR